MGRMTALSVVCLFTFSGIARGTTEERLLPRVLIERCYPHFRALLGLGDRVQALESWRVGPVEHFRVTVEKIEGGGATSRASLDTTMQNINFHTVVTCGNVIQRDGSGERPVFASEPGATSADAAWDGLRPAIPARAVLVDVIDIEFLRQCHAQILSALRAGERFESLVNIQKQESVLDPPSTEIAFFVSKGRGESFRAFAFRATEELEPTDTGGVRNRYRCGAVGAVGALNYRP